MAAIHSSASNVLTCGLLAKRAMSYLDKDVRKIDSGKQLITN
jgi:hypothetical protein